VKTRGAAKDRVRRLTCHEYLSLSALRAGWLTEFVWATFTGCRLARCTILQAQCQCLTRECVVPAYRVSETFGKLLATDGLSRGCAAEPVGPGDEPSGVKALKIYVLSKSRFTSLIHFGDLASRLHRQL